MFVNLSCPTNQFKNDRILWRIFLQFCHEFKVLIDQWVSCKSIFEVHFSVRYFLWQIDKSCNFFGLRLLFLSDFLCQWKISCFRSFSLRILKLYRSRSNQNWKLKRHPTKLLWLKEPSLFEMLHSLLAGWLRLSN